MKKVEDDDDVGVEVLLNAKAEPLSDLRLRSKVHVYTSERPNFCHALPSTSFATHYNSSFPTTYQLLTQDTELIRVALSELLISVEAESSQDQFSEVFIYIFDEHDSSCAIVCGRQTAFWTGTTPYIRKRLKQIGTEFSFFSEIPGFENADLMTRNNSQACTLYFKSSLAVRGMIDLQCNLLKKQTRIVASLPFPNCELLLIRPRVTFEQRMFKTSWENCFWSANQVDQLIHNFSLVNPSLSSSLATKWKVEFLPLTLQFDRACEALYPLEEEEEDDDNVKKPHKV